MVAPVTARQSIAPMYSNRCWEGGGDGRVRGVEDRQSLTTNLGINLITTHQRFELGEGGIEARKLRHYRVDLKLLSNLLGFPVFLRTNLLPCT